MGRIIPAQKGYGTALTATEIETEIKNSFSSNIAVSVVKSIVVKVYG
ncbi:hypothetical protein GCM10025860_01760 [Methanobacterium ferruginis]|nr:hypothetical protein GCM10025860_01760 [Methanobacterium ferruginis]